MKTRKTAKTYAMKRESVPEAPYTIEEVAELMRTSPWVIRSHIRKGHLKRVGGERSKLVSATSVRAFLGEEV